jgi:hypothetical protein
MAFGRPACKVHLPPGNALDGGCRPLGKEAPSFSPSGKVPTFGLPNDLYLSGLSAGLRERLAPAGRSIGFNCYR